MTLDSIRKKPVIFFTAFVVFAVLFFHPAVEFRRSLATLLITFTFAAAVTPLVRRLAFVVKALDVPNDRKIHKEPTPLLGGLVIFSAIGCSLFLFSDFTREVIGVLIATAIVFACGMLDDIVGGIPSKVRILVQVAASGIAVYFGASFNVGAETSWGPYFSAGLTVFWMVGITNAMNFIDGMDGLAGGVSAVAAFFFYAIGNKINDPHLALISIALCGGCLGFLLHNFKPATIFLGDAGSTTLGFMLAGLSSIGTWSTTSELASISIPVVVLGVPFFDMTYTTVERFYTGKVHNISEWFSYTGKDHVHHRLRTMGLSDRQAAVLIYFVSFSVGCMAFTMSVGSSTHAYAQLSACIAWGLILAVFITVGVKGRKEQ